MNMKGLIMNKICQTSPKTGSNTYFLVVLGEGLKMTTFQGKLE